STAYFQFSVSELNVGATQGAGAMATEVMMPKLSPTMEEGQVARWLKKEGDTVSMGEPLAEIDTDKATMEMQALSSGVLRKILIKKGEPAPLGQMIAIIGAPDEDIPAMLSKGPAAKAPAPAAPAAKPEQPAVSEPPVAAGGNGKQGEVAAAPSGRLIVSPLAARMAAEAGIDLRSLSGSGPGGRIIKRDIEAAMSGGATTVAVAAAKPAPTFVSAQVAGASAFRDEPISQMRKVIAQRLVTSIGPVPHFFLTTEIEMDRVVEMRRSINELDPDLKLSINDI